MFLKMFLKFHFFEKLLKQLFNIHLTKHSFFEFQRQVERSGVIERPLLMLEVRGPNPGHSASKNTTSLPGTP